jgi:mono/diheme cytochrome c family protein
LPSRCGAADANEPRASNDIQTGEIVVVSIRKCGVLTLILLIGFAPQRTATADQARGRILAEQQCSHCHAVKRDEVSSDPEAPSFAEVAAEPSITEYMLRVFLKTSHPTMPNLIIKPEDVDDLVSYIMSLKPKKASARPNH